MADDDLETVLEDLRELDGVRGASVLRQDGLLLAADLPNHVNSERIGAMTASTVGAGRNQSSILGLDDVEHITIDSSEGTLLSTHADDRTILSVLTHPDADTAPVLSAMHEHKDRIRDLL